MLDFDFSCRKSEFIHRKTSVFFLATRNTISNTAADFSSSFNITNIKIFQDVLPYSLIDKYQLLGGSYFLHLQGRRFCSCQSSFHIRYSGDVPVTITLADPPAKIRNGHHRNTARNVTDWASISVETVFIQIYEDNTRWINNLVTKTALMYMELRSSLSTYC